MYKTEFDMRYSEAGADGRLKLSAMMDHFQNAAIAHADALGGTIEMFKKLEAAFLLYSWRVEVSEYPKLPQKLTVSTWIESIKGMYCKRILELKNQDGAVAARAESVWVLTGMRRMRPMRMTEDIIEMLGNPIDNFDNSCIPSIQEPNECKVKELYSVCQNDLDTNSHVNNVRSIDILTKKLRFSPAYLEVVYKKAIPPYAEPELRIDLSDDTYNAALYDPEGAPCVLLSARRQQTP